MPRSPSLQLGSRRSAQPCSIRTVRWRKFLSPATKRGKSQPRSDRSLTGRSIDRQCRSNTRSSALVRKDCDANIASAGRNFQMTQHSQPNAPTPFVDTANFAARDENVRCLSYGVLRKLAGLPQDLFTDHWANFWPVPNGVRRMDVVLDGAAEIGFADIDGLKRYADASPVLFGDVFHLFEHIVAYNLPRGSHTLVDREPDGIPNGPDRLYRLHLHLNGGSGEGFRPWLSEWARHLAFAPAVRKLRLHLPEPYDNAHPSPHGDHQVSDERKDVGA